MIRTKLILSIILAGSYLTGFGQKQFTPNEKYMNLTQQAFDLFIKSKNNEAALLYDSAFKVSKGEAYSKDRYWAAFVWQIAGNRVKALYNLKKAVMEGKYADVRQITSDVKFMKIKNDSTFEPYIAVVQKNKEDREAQVDKTLVAELGKIHKEDQTYRLKIDSVQKNFGLDSKEMKELWNIIHLKDSINTVYIKNLIDSRGWLGEDKVGKEGNRTIFLVVQHADPATQEKYLPVMRKAVKEGNAEAASLALLEDRTRMNKGEKQLYGSQVTTDPATGKPFWN